MLQFSDLTIEKAVANQSEAMETRDHFKNGACLKSQTSRRNILKLASTLFAACFIFVSCNNGDDDNDGLAGTSVVTTITATVEGGAAYNDKIDEVWLIMGTINLGRDGEVIKTVPYQNGGFTVDLTTVTVPESYLSDKILNNPLGFFGAKDGETVAVFYYQKGWENVSMLEEGEGTIAMFIFSDSDIIHNFKESGVAYNLNIKSGWNMVYTTSSRSGGGVFSTNAVNGLKWIVMDYWGD